MCPASPRTELAGRHRACNVLRRQPDRETDTEEHDRDTGRLGWPTGVGTHYENGLAFVRPGHRSWGLPMKVGRSETWKTGGWNGRKESGKFEGLPRRGWDGKFWFCGVRRLFENSTVCLIVNAKYF